MPYFFEPLLNMEPDSNNIYYVQHLTSTRHGFLILFTKWCISRNLVSVGGTVPKPKPCNTVTCCMVQRKCCNGGGGGGPHVIIRHLRFLFDLMPHVPHRFNWFWTRGGRVKDYISP